MAKLFWDNLISIREIQIKIKDQDLKEEEKLKLLDITYQTFNLRVIDLVLTSLPKKKHKSFLSRFAKKPNDPKLLNILKEDIDDIEERVMALANNVKREILQELEEM